MNQNFFRFFDIRGGIATLKNLYIRLNYAYLFNDEHELSPNTFIKNTMEGISFEDFKDEMKKFSLANILLLSELKSLYSTHKKTEEESVKKMRLVFKHFRKNYLILCLTKEINNQQMWNNYAQQSEGIAVEFQASEEKDNIFLLAKPVLYIDELPRLYKSFSEKLNSAHHNIMTSQKPENTLKKMHEKFCYRKTKQWEYEKEWRILIPASRFTKDPSLDELALSRDEQLQKGIIEPWNKIKGQDILLDKQDIKGIYLGHRCKRLDEILYLKNRIYPQIPLYQGFLSEDCIDFKSIGN